MVLRSHFWRARARLLRITSKHKEIVRSVCCHFRFIFFLARRGWSLVGFGLFGGFDDVRKVRRFWV